MVMPLNASKLDLVDTRMAETATQVEKVIAILNRGSVDPRVPLLLGNNGVEMAIATSSTVMEVPHHHGRPVVAAAAAAITTAATDKAVVTEVLPAVERLLGNDRRMLLHLLPRAISMAMVATQEAMEALAAVTVVSRRWVLHPVLVAGLVVSGLHQVWALCSRTMAGMELQVALHLHHLRTIFLPR